MSAKHTPGPWICDGTFVYALTPYVGSEHHSSLKMRFPDGVNRFSLSIQGGNKESAGPSEMRANAHLIAAAPDLMEVCKRLAELDLNGTDDSLVRFIVLAHQNSAKTAIAKATGEEAP